MPRQFVTIYDIFCPVPFLRSPLKGFWILPDELGNFFHHISISKFLMFSAPLAQSTGNRTEGALDAGLSFTLRGGCGAEARQLPQWLLPLRWLAIF